MTKTHNTMETTEKINAIERDQHAQRAIMKQSDEHALKCAKSGLNFKKTYPEDWAAYEAARIKYNENETALAALYEQLEAERQAEESAQAEMMSATGMEG